ncbi:MAG: endonuclease/exonuclease/phosphatase family protein [Hyphomicrobiales bacterium]
MNAQSEAKRDWHKNVRPIRPVFPSGAALLCAISLALAALCLGLGYLGGIWIPFDAVSHLRVHLIGAIAGLAVAIGVLFLTRRKRFAGACLVIAAIATVIFAGYWPGHDQQPGEDLALSEGEVKLRLMWFNIWSRNRDDDKIVAAVKDANADVVLFAETAPSRKALLEQLKTDYPHQAQCWHIPYCGIAILSKVPFEEATPHARWAGPAMIRVRFGKEFKGVTLFAVHLVRPNTPFAQWEQIKSLAGATFTAEGPVIVAGDFNATPYSIMLLGLSEFAGLWRMTELPSWPTWFFGFPQLSIDHQFISNGVRPLNFPKLGKDGGSDHLPMIGTYGISPPLQ